MSTSRRRGRRTTSFWTGLYDDYTRYLAAGSAGALGREMGLEAAAVLAAPHAAPGLRHLLAGAGGRPAASAASRSPCRPCTSAASGTRRTSTAPPASYAALEAKDTANDRNFLVLGPWRHGGSNGDGRSLGAIRFDGDTALTFRRDVLQPFLDRYLKTTERQPDAGCSAAAGARLPDRRRPLAALRSLAAELRRRLSERLARKLYLEPGFGLGFHSTCGYRSELGNLDNLNGGRRRLRLRPGETGALSPAPGPADVGSRLDLGRVAGRRPAFRLGPHRRPGLRLRRSRRAARGRGHAR